MRYICNQPSEGHFQMGKNSKYSYSHGKTARLCILVHTVCLCIFFPSLQMFPASLYRSQALTLLLNTNFSMSVELITALGFVRCQLYSAEDGNAGVSNSSCLSLINISPAFLSPCSHSGHWMTFALTAFCFIVLKSSA